MENKYKIKFNASKPDGPTIDKHKDFDALYKEYNETKVKVKRRGKFSKLLPWIGVAAAATVALFMTVFGGPKDKPQKTKDFLAAQEYVTPPVNDKLIQDFKTAKVDAHTGGKVTIKSTTFHIPPKAFVNRAGNLVAGEVEIKLKEYHDYVDFFLSGIPMEYDSLGTRYQLESAGMIEVYAEQDGDRVELALNKTIDIQLESEISVDKNATKAPNFNIYRLDTENRNWVYEAEDDIAFSEEINFEEGGMDSPEQSLNKEIEKIDTEFKVALERIEKQHPTPVVPQKPQRADSDAYTFELDIEDLQSARNSTAIIRNDNSGGPEEKIQVDREEDALRALKKKYAKAVWEVLPNQANWTPSIAQTEWEDFDLKKSGKFDFTVTFIKGDNSVDIKVKPVLVGADYDEAMAAFSKEFGEYENELQERNNALAESKKELEKAREIRGKAAQLAYEEKIKLYKDAGRDNLATEEMIRRKIVNNFTISSFGIWNCDRPLPPFVYEITGKFEDNNKKSFSGQMAYLVDKDRNTVYRFVAKDPSQIRYNQKSDNILWFITKDNKLATYKPEAFKGIQNGTKNHTFVMNLEEANIDNEEDIRRILKF